ncbi:MAG: lipid A 3-O-deacylase [Azoarcus sp.]|nr:lipid A 3-O-deacylase [Azoarcus sp.]
MSLLILSLASLWSFPSLASGQTGTDTLSLVLENDLFYDTDGNYTNGVRAAWLSAPDQAPEWALRAARRLPFFPEDGTVRTSYAIGQNMYTPQDIEIPNPPLDDRPYAGWLYGSIGLIAETGGRLDQLELTLGIVGPPSLAEQTQTFVHEVVGAPKPRGWDTQLKNEPGVILTHQRSWRRFVEETGRGNTFDMTPHEGDLHECVGHRVLP